MSTHLDLTPSGPGEPAEHVCHCGHGDDGSVPELDVRAIPHAVRHGAALGALESRAPGAPMVIVADHEPRGLLAQMRRRFPAGVEVEVLDRTAGAWRLQLTRA